MSMRGIEIQSVDNNRPLQEDSLIVPTGISMLLFLISSSFAERQAIDKSLAFSLNSSSVD